MVKERLEGRKDERERRGKIMREGEKREESKGEKEEGRGREKGDVMKNEDKVT